jgi:hypothetical protein
MLAIKKTLIKEIKMGTRSAIAKKTEEGYEWIYCHWDGYPENQLPLLQNYNTKEKVDELLALRGLSYLGNEIGEKQNFDNPTNKNWCLSYWRDREEEHEGPHKVPNRKSLVKDARSIDCEYIYVFENNKWMLY